MKKLEFCVVCGGKLPEKRSCQRKYCSEHCKRTAEKDAAMGKIAKRAAKMQPIRHEILRVYERKCAVCGWQASDELITVNGKTQYAHGNEIHHIIPVEKGGGEEWENLILLCPNHHKMAHCGTLPAKQIKKYLREYEEIDSLMAKNTCADTIAAAIWGD